MKFRKHLNLLRRRRSFAEDGLRKKTRSCSDKSSILTGKQGQANRVEIDYSSHSSQPELPTQRVPRPLYYQHRGGRKQKQPPTSRMHERLNLRQALNPIQRRHRRGRQGVRISSNLKINITERGALIVRDSSALAREAVHNFHLNSPN